MADIDFYEFLLTIRNRYFVSLKKHSLNLFVSMIEYSVSQLLYYVYSGTLVGIE